MRNFFGSLTPKLLPKLPSELFNGEICLTKLKGFTFLRQKLYEGYPWEVKFQSSEYSWTPIYSYQKCAVSSTVKFALQNSRFLPFLGGICMQPLGCEILSIFLVIVLRR
jgi:hypothetical protein